MIINWSLNAKEDYKNALHYLMENNLLAAAEIADKIEGSIKLLSQNPFMRRKSDLKNTRELVIPQTNYIVIYRVEAEDVEILQIYHVKQHWKR